VWQPTALYGTLPARPDQTIAGTISHQTSTGDASSTTDLPLSNQSRLIVNDDGLDDPRHDLLYGHQMKMVISTYNTATKTHILTNAIYYDHKHSPSSSKNEPIQCQNEVSD